MTDCWDGTQLAVDGHVPQTKQMLSLEGLACRIIPVSKWLITMVKKSLSKVDPLANGLFMAYKWWLPTTYMSWDDPPSFRHSER